MNEKQREYNTHKSHCFRDVDGEFLGCKYGSDENCPVFPERDMLNKWAANFDDAKVIFEFLEWYHSVNQGRKDEELVYDYFDIDEKKLEEQRWALMESIKS